MIQQLLEECEFKWDFNGMKWVFFNGMKWNEMGFQNQHKIPSVHYKVISK